MADLLFKGILPELRVQVYSMVKTAKRKVTLAILFVVLFGFSPNSGVAQSHWGSGQTDPRAQQTAPAQTTNKNTQDVKDLEALNKFLSVARKRVEEYNTLF